MSFVTPKNILSHFQIDEGMNVADLGAGSGFYTMLLGEQVGSYGRVYAIDINENALQKIEEESKKMNWGHVRTIKADLSSPESILSSSIVDRIILSNTLYALEEKLLGLSHAYSLLVPDGKMVLIDWKHDDHPSIQAIGPKREYRLPQSDAEKLASFAGFVKEREIPAGDYHYGVVFKKL